MPRRECRKSAEKERRLRAEARARRAQLRVHYWPIIELLEDLKWLDTPPPERKPKPRAGRADREFKREQTAAQDANSENMAARA